MRSDWLPDWTGKPSAEQQIEGLYAEFSERPSAELATRLAKLLEISHDATKLSSELKNSVEWYEEANQRTKGKDPLIAKRLAELRFKAVDLEIQTIRGWLTHGGDQHEDTREVCPSGQVFRDHLREPVAFHVARWGEPVPGPGHEAPPAVRREEHDELSVSRRW